MQCFEGKRTRRGKEGGGGGEGGKDLCILCPRVKKVCFSPYIPCRVGAGNKSGSKGMKVSSLDFPSLGKGLLVLSVLSGGSTLWAASEGPRAYVKCYSCQDNCLGPAQSVI